MHTASEGDVIRHDVGAAGCRKNTDIIQVARQLGIAREGDTHVFKQDIVRASSRQAEHVLDGAFCLSDADGTVGASRNPVTVNQRAVSHAVKHFIGSVCAFGDVVNQLLDILQGITQVERQRNEAGLVYHLITCGNGGVADEVDDATSEVLSAGKEYLVAESE